MLKTTIQLYSIDLLLIFLCFFGVQMLIVCGRCCSAGVSFEGVCTVTAHLEHNIFCKSFWKLMLVGMAE